MSLATRAVATCCMRLLVAGFVTVCLAAAASAQAPAPLAIPNPALYASGGTVFALLRLPDGGLVVGGDFVGMQGAPRQYIAKLLSDGTLDPNWNPSANGPVKALAADANGNIFVGGDFTSINGESRSHIAKLLPDGTLDANWNLPTNGVSVYAIVVDTDGNVFLGGYFSIVDNQSRPYIAKLLPDHTLDMTWDPSADAPVRALAVDGSGNLFVGGSFTSIGGQARNYIAKLQANGAADLTWNPSANSLVDALAVNADGDVYVGGYFASTVASFISIGGQPRNYIAKLSGSGAGDADATWNPSPGAFGGATPIVWALAVDAAGDVLVGGAFGSIGGQPASHLARLSSSGTGAADATWNPSPNDDVKALAQGDGGVVYAGGAFKTIGGQPRCGFARLDGTTAIPGIAVNVDQPGHVYALARQPGGGLIVGGAFYRTDDLLRGNLLRVRPDGTVDADWNPSADGFVYALAVDGDNDVYAGGGFSNVGGQPRTRIVKLSGSAGAADATWNPSANGDVSAVAVDTAGSVYAGGSFSSIGGQTRLRIAKLSGTGAGAADATWSPSANAGVNALVVDAIGTVFAGGAFTSMGGETHNRLAKLLPNGTPDSNWNPSPNGTVNAIAFDAAGSNLFVGGVFSGIGVDPRNHLAKLSVGGPAVIDATWKPSAASEVVTLAVDPTDIVYAGGWFTTVDGQSHKYIAKLQPSGTLDSTWNSSTNATVRALAVDATGDLFAGGDFSTVSGQTRFGFAKLPACGDCIFTSGFE